MSSSTAAVVFANEIGSRIKKATDAGLRTFNRETYKQISDLCLVSVEKYMQLLYCGICVL